MTPRRLYRTLAVAEAVTWALLLLGMVLKYGTGTTDLGVRVGGGLHGFVFLAYCAGTVLVGVDQRWPARSLLLGLAAAVPPFVTVPFERRAERAGLLGEQWRLREQAAAGTAESAAAVALRRPVASAVVVVLAVAAVFAGLVSLGPPTQWSS